MRDRVAAYLAHEENVVKQCVRTESLRGLRYLFSTQTKLERSEFKALLASSGFGDRLGTAQVTALLNRGLLATDSPHGELRLGVPQHALRFYFPHLWSEAEIDGQQCIFRQFLPFVAHFQASFSVSAQ